MTQRKTTKISKIVLVYNESIILRPSFLYYCYSVTLDKVRTISHKHGNTGLFPLKKGHLSLIHSVFVSCGLEGKKDYFLSDSNSEKSGLTDKSTLLGTIQDNDRLQRGRTSHDVVNRYCRPNRFTTETFTAHDESLSPKFSVTLRDEDEKRQTVPLSLYLCTR